jgi:hypothetical protein
MGKSARGERVGEPMLGISEADVGGIAQESGSPLGEDDARSGISDPDAPSPEQWIIVE